MTWHRPQPFRASPALADLQKLASALATTLHSILAGISRSLEGEKKVKAMNEPGVARPETDTPVRESGKWREDTGLTNVGVE